MEFSQPPPSLPGSSSGSATGFSVPPPGGMTAATIGPSVRPPGGDMHDNHRGGFHNNHRGGHHHGGHRHHHGGGGAGTPGQPFFRPFANFARGPGGLPMTQDDFDGKRLRKSVMRKTVDYNAAIIRALQTRVWQRDFRDRRALQPESIYAPDMLPPPSYMDNPINAVTTRFVKTATNKMRCPIFTLAWTPEGRRLVTGASSGEFTLWNGLTFNFETILQAHDCPVRTMVWSHNDNWMVTGDHQGNVKYWQSNMNNVRQFQAHKEPVRGISFSPSDNKFVSCSDDGTLRVFDFLRCQEEKVLRGHGADVKCVHWHPQKALIVSGSKDNQQPIKLWDPKSGQALATLHAHKSTVMDLKWNDNGNWLITASRDHLLKLFDLRNLKEEVQVFRGHKKEASAVSWHPVHEGLFSSGGSDGSILFWNVGTDKEVGAIDTAHDSIVWTLAWHPLGHILCSGSNDHTIKFWTRNRPGDQMRDKYNLNTLPMSLQGLEECDLEDNHIIPGMGPEDKIDFTESLTADRGFIPGLDLDVTNFKDRNERDKKVPYSKPIPRNFIAQWNDPGRPNEDEGNGMDVSSDGAPKSNAPSAILVYGVTIPLQPGTRLAAIVAEGPMILNRFISAREVPELNDLLPKDETLPDGGEAEVDLFYDHNVQLIYDNDQNNHTVPPPTIAGITPGTEINIHEPPPDFRGSNNGPNMTGPDVWQPPNGGPPPNAWAGGPPTNINPFANGAMLNPPPNMMGGMGMDGNGPAGPQLGNWDGPPPGRMDGGNSFRQRGPDKFRRMDEDGRRMSRFDNNDGGGIRNRRPPPPIGGMNDNNMDMSNNAVGFGGFGGFPFANNQMDVGNNGPNNSIMSMNHMGGNNGNMMGNNHNMMGNNHHNMMMGNNNVDNNGPNNFNNMANRNFNNNNNNNRGNMRGIKRRF